MSTKEIMRKARLAAMRAEAEAAKNPKPPVDDALVSDATKESVGRMGKWAAGKAKDLAQAAADKTKQAKDAAEHKLAQQRQVRETQRLEDEARKASELTRKADEQARQEQERHELEAAEVARAPAATAPEPGAVGVGVGASPRESAAGAEQGQKSTFALSAAVGPMTARSDDVASVLVDEELTPGVSVFGETSAGMTSAAHKATAEVWVGEEATRSPSPAPTMPAQRASIPRSWLLAGGGVLVVAGLVGGGLYLFQGADESPQVVPAAPVEASTAAPIAPAPAPVVEPEAPVVVEDTAAAVADEPAATEPVPVVESISEPVSAPVAVPAPAPAPAVVKETPAPAAVAKPEPRNPVPAPAAKAPTPKPAAAPKPVPAPQPKPAPKKEEWQEKANQDIDAWAEQLGL